MEKLEGIQQEIYWQFPQLQRLRQEYDAIVSEMEPKLKRLNTEIEETWERISDELNWRSPNFDEYLEENPLPEAEIAQELENPLYDSNRDYFTQLAVYKQHQGKRVVF